jgi:hypothetical protein
MNQPLTTERFRALAEAYGGRLERWPDAERKAARELLLQHPELRAVLAEEAALDGVFAAESPASLSPALRARLDSVVEARQAFPLSRRSLLAPAIGWAIAAGVGLWLGVSLDEPEIAEITGSDTVVLDAADDESGVLELAAGELEAFEEVP